MQWDPDTRITRGLCHSPLQAAAHSGKLEIVRLLLDRHVKEDSYGGVYRTALNAAAERGSLEMVQSLVEADENIKETVNIPGGTHGFPIISAAFRGQNEMVRLLIQVGTIVDSANDSNSTALHAAAAGRHKEVVLTLLQEESNVDGVSQVYGTPLHAASSRGYEDIAMIMVGNGANVALKDPQQRRTALHEAARLGLESLTMAILKSGKSEVNDTDIDGNTALHHAAIGGHAAIVSNLVAWDINVSICDKFKAQALFRAAGCNHASVVGILLRQGKADPSARDCFGRTALHGPSETDDPSIHRMLLKAGADVNAVGEDKKTALHEACNMGKYNLVELLLAQPTIDVNVVDNENQTALFRAMSSNHWVYLNQCIEPRIVDLMLSRDDIDVNACHALALQEAARQGMYNAVETMLVKHKGNVRIEGGKYGSVVQAAAIGGHVNILELLLSPSWRANVNARGGEYGTPLSAAVAYGHVEASRFLLDAGAAADFTGVGRYGSPIQSVCQMTDATDPTEMNNKKKQIAEILQRYSGQTLQEIPVEMPHLDERWTQTTGGWTFFPKGDL